jgi:hypothetical protein
VHEGRPAERGGGFLWEPEHPGGAGAELRAATAVPAHVRRLQVDEVSRDRQGVVEGLAVQHAAGFGLEGQDGIPRLGLAEPIEPAASVRDEQIGESRVVRAVAAIAGGVEGVARREEAADRLHVMAEVHDPHRERDGFTALMGGKAIAVPALEREAQGLTNAGAEVEPLHEHVCNFAPGREVVHRPLVRRLLEHPDDFVALVLRARGRSEGHHVAHDLTGIGGVVDQRLGANRDLVAEHGGDLVGVTGAADVPQQRHPIGGLAHLVFDSCRLADPRGEKARSQLGLERLAERVVLRERQRGYELTEAKWRGKDGAFSRCIGAHSRARWLHDARRGGRSGRLTTLNRGGHHGGTSNPWR